MPSNEAIAATRLADLAILIAGRMSFPAMAGIMFAVRTRVQAAGDENWLDAVGHVWPADTKPVLVDLRDPEIKKVYDLAESIVSGGKQDNLTNGGIYWSGPGIYPWFSMHGREKTAVIGQLEFWK